MGSVLNKKEVKAKALRYADMREHKFTRVSKEFITALESKVDELIRVSVRQHPSRGKTITQLL